MEYQRITNLLGNASDQPSKLRTKNWVEIKMMNQEEYIILILLNLRLQC